MKIVLEYIRGITLDRRKAPFTIMQRGRTFDRSRITSALLPSPTPCQPQKRGIHENLIERNYFSNDKNMRRGCGRGAGPFPVWGRQGDLGHTPMSRSGRIRLLWRSMCPPANRSRRRMIGLDSRSCLKKGGSTPECVESEPPETYALGF